jgi:hypothetical protein
MFGIGHLFKKMQNRQTREYFVRDIIRQVIKEVVGADVLVDNIQIKDSTASIINTNQSLKSEIYIKKQRILRLCNEKQDVIVIGDIR